MSQNVIWRILFLTLLFVAGAALVATAQESTPKSLEVTVHYTGTGSVDKEHLIWVWLFDSPDMGSAGRPLSGDATSENGGRVVFKALTSSPVYIAVGYDESGSYDGFSGPPPSGMPVSAYSADGMGPSPVELTETETEVAVTFDDSFRLP